MSTWATRRLGDLLRKTETADPTSEPGKAFTYIDVSSVSNVSFTVQETQELLGKDAPSRARRRVEAGDVIFATVRPTLQRIAVIPEHLDGAVCSTGYFVLRTSPELDRSYLFYWLFSDEFRCEMEKRQRGASYPAVTDRDIRDQAIPLPPLEEQRRIVAVLDEAFAAIATATANAEKNLASALELRHLLHRRAFASVGSRQLLGEVATFRNGVNFNSSSQGEEVQIVGVKDFQNNLCVPEEDLARVRIDGILPDSDLLRTGDILTVRSNGNKELIGRCMIAIVVDGRTTHSGFTIRIRPNPEQVDPEYLCRYLRSPEARASLVANGTGANISSLNQKALTMLPIPMVPRPEQRSFVAALARMDDLSENLETAICAKMARLRELKKSLLHQAFAGELTGRRPLAV